MIDRSFVSRLPSGERYAAIVRSTVDMAHSLGLHVVAEGVEDRPTLSMLAELGCDAAQGYYFAPAMRAAELGAWLRRTAADQRVLWRAAA